LHREIIKTKEDNDKTTITTLDVCSFVRAMLFCRISRGETDSERHYGWEVPFQVDD
jgi:hypothetical protein